MLLAAAVLGAATTAGGFLLAGRTAARPARTLERRLDRAWQTLEADRARMLTLLLAKDPQTFAVLQSTAPAHAPAPDPDLGPGPDPYDQLGGEFAADVSDLDALDEFALRSARG